MQALWESIAMSFQFMMSESHLLLILHPIKINKYTQRAIYHIVYKYLKLKIENPKLCMNMALGLMAEILWQNVNMVLP